MRGPRSKLSPASHRFDASAGHWSNVGLGLELGSAALAYGIRCGKHHSYLRDTGFKALTAMGAAGTVDLALKLGFDRQFPFKPGSTGKFWGGGRAFPSGHSASSFAGEKALLLGHPDRRNVGICDRDVSIRAVVLQNQNVPPQASECGL
jgi:membrane-associated phospholipid phosphatase